MTVQPLSIPFFTDRTAGHGVRSSHGRSHRRFAVAGIGLVGLTAALTLGMSVPAHADALPVNEGTASGFAVLAGSMVSNTNSSTIVGDIGIHPLDALTGYGPGADQISHTGAVYLADGVALGAKNSATTAYTGAAAQDADQTFPTAELNGLVLTRGVYDSLPGTFNNSGTLTLDAEGDPSAIFIFQMQSTMVMSSGSTVELLNGANSCNVYWVVGSSATLGSGSSTVGTIMADQSIGMDSGATLNGKIWASVAAITLDNNTINTTCVQASISDGSTARQVPGDTSGQVPFAPSGGVSTGDGSTLVQPVNIAGPVALAVTSALGALGALLLLVRSRRLQGRAGAALL